MSELANITVETGKLPFLNAVGVDARAVMRTAGLPVDWLQQPTSRLTATQYRAFLLAMEACAPTPTLPLIIGRNTVSATFHPVAFAALCSSNLRVAASRVRDHTRLCVPKRLDLTDEPGRFTLTWRWEPTIEDMPFSDGATPIVFFVELVRVATRSRVVPARVVLEHPPPDPAFEAFFGIRPEVGAHASLSFHAADAARPFLTENAQMWASFEPDLQHRLHQLEATAPLSERVRGCLMECLPSGEATADTIASRLGMSRRTLSRQLAAEGQSYRGLVRGVRRRLANHYLRNTTVSYGEIAFLLGYDETSSFFRAFRDWEGTTPEVVRRGDGATSSRPGL